MLRDTSYALIRRLNFVKNAIEAHFVERGNAPLAILDIGCGTGDLLTIPLSTALGSNAIIYAFEPEFQTYQSLVKRTRELEIQNIHPIQEKEQLQNSAFDVLILSEVIEHVDDPIYFLNEFQHLLNASGIMIITTPNGYGIFELEMLLFNTLERIGLIPTLRKLRNVFQSPGNQVSSAAFDTLAISPHLNFFTLGDLEQILTRAGFSLKRIEGKHLAAGPFSDRVINKSEKLIKLNAYLGEKLPLIFVSGWMLVAEKTRAKSTKITYFELFNKINPLRRLYSQYKRWLNIYLANRAENNSRK